jgi:hypothetical protein
MNNFDALATSKKHNTRSPSSQQFRSFFCLPPPKPETFENDGQRLPNRFAFWDLAITLDVMDVEASRLVANMAGRGKRSPLQPEPVCGGCHLCFVDGTMR